MPYFFKTTTRKIKWAGYVRYTREMRNFTILKPENLKERDYFKYHTVVS
jgi:hypothetical protein